MRLDHCSSRAPGLSSPSYSRRDGASTTGISAPMSARGKAAQRPPAPRLSTIQDVARLAGVGRTTASDAIQGRGRVAAETRDRVLAAVEQLGYRAHIGARDMRRQRTEIVGVVVGDLFDPFCAELTAHIEQLAAERGYRVLLATAGADLTAETRAITSLMEHRVAAVILISFTGDQSVRDTVGSHTPIVCIGYEGPHGVSIGIDDRRGGRLATEHLVALGHRRIAYVSSSGVPRKTDRDRRDAYRSVLRRAGISPDRRLVLRLGAGPEAERYARMRELLGQPDPPTAAFVVSDITAIELMSCASGMGLGVPEDVSVVGFDDIMLARVPMIALTTVAQPIGELARRGVDTAIALIEQPGTTTQVPRIEPELIVRGTTGPPPLTSA
jgi:DNA-binding LacI/PurR family transcriptional regulator